MPVIISILFFIIYYIITISFEKFAREDILSSFTGMWMASFILFPAGVFLTYKATTDSVILNVDTYINFFKKIYNPGVKLIINETEHITTLLKENAYNDKPILNEVLQKLFNKSNNIKNSFKSGFIPAKLLSKSINSNLEEELRKFIGNYCLIHNGLVNSHIYNKDKYFKSSVNEMPAIDPSEFNLFFIPQSMKIIFLTLLLPIGIFLFIISIIKIKILVKRLTLINEISFQLLKKVNI
jgi:lipopolysaccharide export system permease protein